MVRLFDGGMLAVASTSLWTWIGLGLGVWVWYILSSSAGIWFTQDTCASMKLARYWASGRVAKRKEAARVLLSADLLAKSIPSSRLLMAWTSSIGPLTFWLRSAASLLLVSRCLF